MASPPSEKAIDALAKLREHGELQRSKNGYWTYPGCAAHHREGSNTSKCGGYNVPEWHVSTATINALIKREIAVVVEKNYGRPSLVKLAQLNFDDIISEQTSPGIVRLVDKAR